jgi:tetratricopeptide (TPR) repeat protein
MNEVAALERASALCDLRRYDDAAGQLRTVLATDPHNTRGLCLMAQVQLGQAVYDHALRTSQAAIAENPEIDWPYRLASLALSRLGRHQDARAMARTAIRLAPHEPQCHTMLARVHASSGKDLGEARTAAERAISLAPHDPASHIVVGMVAAADTRIEDATAAFHRALALEPNNSTAHHELARLQLKKHRFGNPVALAQAAGGFATALRADPRARMSRRNLDFVLHVSLGRMAYAMFVVAFFARQLHGISDAGPARWLPAMLLALPILIAVRFVAGLTPELRAQLMRLLRTPFIACAAVCDGVAAAALVVGAAVQRASSMAFGLAAIFALLALLILRLQTRRKFRRTRPL